MFLPQNNSFEMTSLGVEPHPFHSFNLTLAAKAVCKARK
jgi:hypothetical protein